MQSDVLWVLEIEPEIESDTVELLAKLEENFGMPLVPVFFKKFTDVTVATFSESASFVFPFSSFIAKNIAN